jgi:hypothetical protein
MRLSAAARRAALCFWAFSFVFLRAPRRVLAAPAPSPPPPPPPPPLSDEEVGSTWTTAAFLVAGIVLLIGLFHLALWRRNKRTKIAPEKIQLDKKPRPKWQKALIFFFKYVFLELLDLVFTIVSVISLFSRDWGKLEMTGVTTGFLFFSVFKYALLILTTWMDKTALQNHFQDKTATRFGFPPDWPQILESVAFIPIIIIDGFIINAEWTLDDVGDFIPCTFSRSRRLSWMPCPPPLLANLKLVTLPDDSVIMLIIGLLIYIKLMMRLILKTHSVANYSHHFIEGTFHATLSLCYTLMMAFLLVVVHLNNVKITGMALTWNMVVIIFNIIAHPYLASYTSMTRQSIIALDRAFRGSANLRVQQLKIYIAYFREKPVYWAVGAVLHLLTYYVYVSIFIVGISMTSDLRPERTVQLAIAVVLISVCALTVYFTIHLVIASVKRIGALLGKKHPFNCESYARYVNFILKESNASFVMNTRMQVHRA